MTTGACSSSSGHLLSYGTRLRLAGLAGVAGWIGGFAASLPAQVIVGLRDTGGEPRLFAETMMLGMAVWGAWTLLLGLGAWLIFALPCALLIEPEWLVRFRVRVLLMTAMIASALVVLELHSFEDYAASRVVLRFALFLPYGAFALLFAVVTAWWYIRLAAKQLHA